MANVGVSRRSPRPVFEGQPLPQAEGCGRGGASRNAHLRLTIGGHHRDHASQGQFIEADGQVGSQLIRLQAPDRVLLNLQI